ncbi:MAG: trypsin-like peptidase domain-containing protein [Rhodomicrobium sp.]
MTNFLRILSGCLVGAFLAFTGGALFQVKADELSKASKAVKAATNEELLAEFQRRFQTRTRGLRSLNEKALQGRAVSPLADIDDGALVQATRMNSRAIYGIDTRVEYFEIKDEAVRAVARASVALFFGESVEPAGQSASLVTRPLQKSHGIWHRQLDLCPGEKFAGEPVGAFCSGTLVREDIVLTAGHCVSEISNSPNIPPIGGVRFVFGYRVEKDGANPTRIPSSQIFSGYELLGGETNTSRDWALIRLDRPVPAEIASPVISWSTGVAKGAKVFVIGYPSGIPLKYAPGAEVRDDADPNYFVANLDTFGGNSGSGVSDQTTKKLAGILFRGDTDYVEDKSKSCMRVNVCPRTGCSGEYVTRLDEPAKRF